MRQAGLVCLLYVLTLVVLELVSASPSPGLISRVRDVTNRKPSFKAERKLLEGAIDKQQAILEKAQSLADLTLKPYYGSPNTIYDDRFESSETRQIAQSLVENYRQSVSSIEDYLHKLRWQEQELQDRVDKFRNKNRVREAQRAEKMLLYTEKVLEIMEKQPHDLFFALEEDSARQRHSNRATMHRSIAAISLRLSKIRDNARNVAKFDLGPIYSDI